MKKTLTTITLLTLTLTLGAQPFGGGRPGGGREGGGPRPPERNSGRMMPASLRLGLIQTLGRIATNEAEAVLVKQLRYTASGVEVSLIDQSLTAIAEGEHKYKTEVLAAAKAIILDPPKPSAVPTDLERRAEGELWGILVRHKDASFAESAEKLLLDAEGNVNGRALNYFREVLKDKSVPVLAAAYYDPDISDRAKGDLWGTINDHIDTHPAAGEILVERFKETVGKMAQEDAERARREAERAANPEGQGGRGGRGGGFDWRGGRGGGGSRGSAVREIQRLGEGRDVSAEAIANRRSILTSLKGTTNDADFQTMFASVEKRLDELANPTEETSSRFRVEDPREAARREEMRKRIEEFRNRGREGGQSPAPKKQ